jgi:hypothetical protein
VYPSIENFIAESLLTIISILQNILTVYFINNFIKQQNPFIPMFDNLEALITWHLRVVPRPEVLLLPYKKHYHCNRQISGACLKKPPRVSGTLLL